MNKYFTALIISVAFFACSDPSISQGEVLYLRNHGNDMPAYLYGNFDSKTFIVLLHGGPGGNGLEYRSGKYAEMLEEHFAVVYWDQRGQGNSRGNNHHEQLDIDLLLDDLDKLIALLKNQYGSEISLFLYGHSWGGTYGSKYLMDKDRQDQFKGWIESNGAHDIPKINREAISMFLTIGQEEINRGNNVSDWQEIVDFAKGIDTTNITVDDGGQINQYGHKAEELLADKLGDDSGVFRMPVRNPCDPLSSSIAGNRTSNILVQNGIEDIALTDSLNRIKIPSLILSGKYDFVVPPQLGIDASKEIDASLVVFKLYEKSGHSPMNHEATEYANDIIEFVNRYR